MVVYARRAPLFQDLLASHRAAENNCGPRKRPTVSMLPAVLPALLVCGVDVAPALPPSASVALWNTSTGTLLNQWTRAPYRAAFGSQPANVSATLVVAKTEIACAGSEPTWNGNAVLGGDWTKPGCSIEVRAKNFQDSGALAAIFQGTEGLPFDWDGSTVADIHIAVVIVGYKDYDELQDAATIAAGSVPPLVAFAPKDTPLLLDSAFRIVERAIQVAFFIAASYVFLFAAWQLVRFRRTARATGDSQNIHAIRVIGCELLATAGMLIYIIDGPGQEHTRPCVLPWFVHRVSLSVHVEFHLLASLVFYWHLRQIRKRVETDDGPTNSPKSVSRRLTGPRRSISGMVSLFLEGRHDDGPGSSSLCSSSFCSILSSSKLFVSVIVICLVCDFASAVLVALYISAGADFTFYTTIFVACVSFSVGAWFAYQALVIIRAIKRAETEAKSGQSVVSKVSKNAKRNGISMMLSIIFAVASELGRQLLLNEGGMTYWWSLLPLWTLMLGFMLLTSFFQIKAFQPPDLKNGKRAGTRVSNLSIGLGSITDTASKGSLEDDNMRGSGMESCWQSTSAQGA